MKALSIRWLLLAVATVSLAVPLIAILSLRSFDSVLVRQTESELNAQAALTAAIYQEEWAATRGLTSGNPRSRSQLSDSFTPYKTHLDSLDEVAPAFPKSLPQRATALGPEEEHLAKRLSHVLRHAQVYNLSGARILGTDGCAIASSRAQIGTCFTSLPEVRQALDGRATSVLRRHDSDEPTPPLSSFQRRGEVRVFVAKPVWNDGKVIGAVWLSRTAESGLEWLFKRRKGVLLLALSIVGLTTATSIAFSLSITRPLSKMVQRLENGSTDKRLSTISAPREIHALGVALDERSSELQAQCRYVAEFSANVSHELKTPLTSIRGAVELLQDLDVPEKQRQTFLTNIEHAVSRTERLVARLLLLARLESPQTLEEGPKASVHEYARSLTSRFGAQIEVELVGDDREIDENALETVTSNLIDNALRYRTRLPVRVTFELDKGPQDKVHIRVQDDGPGISEDNQRRLFDRFFTTERDHGGTGLGLSIVEAAARRRGGRTLVTSGPEGTRAEVWM